MTWRQEVNGNLIGEKKNLPSQQELNLAAITGSKHSIHWALEFSITLLAIDGYHVGKHTTPVFSQYYVGQQNEERKWVPI